MIGFWLGCLLALAPAADGPRLEAALVIPQPQGIVLEDQNVQHYAQQGVTLLPALRPDSVRQLIDGTAARFVTSAQTLLGPAPARLRLPLGGGELEYLAERDGRAQRYRVLNPSAVELRCAYEPLQTGARLALTFIVTQPAGEHESVATNQAGEPLFLKHQIEIEQVFQPGETLLALFASDGRIRVGRGELELNYRQQVVNQTIEATSPLLGVLLHFLPAGEAAAFDAYAPPIAQPGQVAVEGAAPQTGAQRYEPGLTADQALHNAGVPPRAEQRVTVRRMDAGGNLEEFELGAADAPLRERDVLVVEQAATTSPAETFGKDGAPGKPGADGKSGGGAGGPTNAGLPAAPLASPPANSGRLLGPFLLDELRQIAPTAAAASKAAVALRGVTQRQGQEVAFLLAGTLVRSDGLILTAPAAALAGVSQVHATLSDGRELTAQVLGTSSDGSLAALKVEATDLPYLAPSGYRPPAGVAVVVLGHPYGLDRTVTVTVVSGPPRELKAAPGASLQLDGALAAGNSGGPVVDLAGRLVGLAYGNLKPAEPGPAVSLAVAAAQLDAFIATLGPE